MAHFFHKKRVEPSKQQRKKRERNKVRAAGFGFSGIFHRSQSWRVQAEQSSRVVLASPTVTFTTAASGSYVPFFSPLTLSLTNNIFCIA
jgi:hypothetical protein